MAVRVVRGKFCEALSSNDSQPRKSLTLAAAVTVVSVTCGNVVRVPNSLNVENGENVALPLDPPHS